LTLQQLEYYLAAARLSPASREFLRLAQERLATLAETLESRPPRRRRPGS
jgi:hypothetical protein